MENLINAIVCCYTCILIGYSPGTLVYVFRVFIRIHLLIFDYHLVR